MGPILFNQMGTHQTNHGWIMIMHINEYKQIEKFTLKLNWVHFFFQMDTHNTNHGPITFMCIMEWKQIQKCSF